jgi:hypothetical protein
MGKGSQRMLSLGSQACDSRERLRGGGEEGHLFTGSSLYNAMLGCRVRSDFFVSVPNCECKHLAMRRRGDCGSCGGERGGGQ